MVHCLVAVQIAHESCRYCGVQVLESHVARKWTSLTPDSRLKLQHACSGRHACISTFLPLGPSQLFSSGAGRATCCTVASS